VTDGVLISTRDLYDAQRATEQRLAEVAVQLADVASTLREIKGQMADGTTTMNDHETRLRVLEASRWRAQGMAALVGALSGGGFATLVVYLLSNVHH